MPEPVSDMNCNQNIGYLSDSNSFFSNGIDDLLDINLRNLENLSMLDNFCNGNGISGAETNENIVYFHDAEPVLSPYIDDLKEGNISRTVRVPSSEHVAEIVGRQGCKIKDLRARTNTYIKTPMRTQSPVFVVTGKEDAVLHVIGEIQNAAEHFTHIRACRNLKAATGQDVNRPISREGDITIHVAVPYRVVGLVVGLKGQTIKTIQQDTDTFIVTPNRDKAPIFEVRGQPENVERAKMQILRHIEARTRNCRQQDSISVPALWNEDKKHHWSNVPFYRSEAAPQTGLTSSSLSAHNESLLSGIDFSFASLDLTKIFPTLSPASEDCRAWRDEPLSKTDHIASWSKPTFDPSGFLDRSLSSLTNSFTDSPSSTSSYHYAMSSGSASNSSNSSASISPPQHYQECSFSSQQTSHQLEGHKSDVHFGRFGDETETKSDVHFGRFGKETETKSDVHFGRFGDETETKSDVQFGSFGNEIETKSDVQFGSFGNEIETPAFARFPIFSHDEPTTCKRSLVLGSLFQSRNTITSNEGVCFLQEDMENQFHSFVSSSSNGSTLPSISCTLRSGVPTEQEHSFFKSDPGSTCKTGSHISAARCNRSPTLRVCYICQEADVVAALVPCGHNHFCMECAEAIVSKPEVSERKCPACHEIAANVLRIRG